MRTSFRILLVNILTYASVGCIHGLDSRKASLSDLGTAPNQASAISGGPFSRTFDRNKAITVLAGSVWQGDGISRIPLKRALVQVLNGDKLIVETHTEEDGKFRMSGHLAEMEYVIKIVTGKREQRFPITANSYLMDHLEFTLP